MKIKRYQISGDSYICVTFDPETICQKARMLMKQARTPAHEADTAIPLLRQWCLSSTSGDTRSHRSFVVSTL